MTTISHRKFWGLLKKQSGYNEDYKEEIKASWVKAYSEGKTTSLTILYKTKKRQYNKMLKDMEGMPDLDRRDRMNRQRRKLLALVYEFCKHKNLNCTKEQALLIANKACSVKSLNRASEQKLIAAIKAFENNESEAWVTSVLNKVVED
jgi:hypothetical protein